jgi:hypothetical protein
MRKLSVLFMLFAMGFAAAPPASGQNSTSDASPKCVLKEGTELKLKFVEAISSKTAAEDERITFELDRDLRVGETLVAREGAKAVGTVVHVRKAGMMGKGGELNVKLDSLTVGDTRVRLRATKGAKGDDSVGAAVALTVLFGPIGLIKHGKEIEIRAGSELTGYVDQDVSLPAIR